MGEDKIHEKIDFHDSSYSGIVKRKIKDSALKAGFTDSKLGEVEVIVSELISNAIKYADGKCHFLCKSILEDDTPGIEIIYFDDGPGISNPEKMLKDGTSSRIGSLGEGLGAIFRLSDFCDLYTQCEKGTVILIRKFIKRKIKQQMLPEITLGVVGVAISGETYCGDSWHLIEDDKKIDVLISDGLGHGRNAWNASEKAIESFRKNHLLPVPEQLTHMHEDLRKTRGGVCFIYSAALDSGVVSYCGVGNISAKVVSENDKISNCISFNGIVGFTLPSRIHESQTMWNDRDMIIAHSDGLTTKWNLKDYPGIEKHHPTLIAAVLYKNHSRKHDDALIVILKRHKKHKHPLSFML